MSKKKKRGRGRPKKHPFVKYLEKKDTKARKFSHTIPIISIIIAGYFHYIKGIPLYDQSAIFGGIAPFLGVMSIVYLFLYGFLDPDDLTDNIKANKLVAPFMFVGVFSYLTIVEKMPVFNDQVEYWGAFPASMIFAGFYMYCSEYFQPDLDVYGSRPGMTHFPLGKWILYYQWARALKFILSPLTKLWYHLWTPYAFLFTHRGITHYPILSTWLRVGYLYIIFYALNFILVKGFGVTDLLFTLKWLSSFYPWDKGFFSVDWIVFCLPVYLTDFIHIMVDYFDAVKRGMPFCPERIPRGFFAKTWRSFLEIKEK